MSASTRLPECGPAIARAAGAREDHGLPSRTPQKQHPPDPARPAKTARSGHSPAAVTASVSRVFRSVAIACAAAIAVLAAGGMVWYVNIAHLSSSPPSLVPMAPATGVALLLLSAILPAASGAPSARARRAGSVAAVAVAVFGALAVASAVTGYDLTSERLLLDGTRTSGGVIVGVMSPLTGGLLVVTGAALALLLAGLGARARSLAASLGTLAALGACIDILSYLSGSPLLYAPSSVPMALPTAAAIAILGVGILAAAGPATSLASIVVGDSTTPRIARTILPLVAALVLIQGLFAAWLEARKGDNELVMSAQIVVYVVFATVVAAASVRSIGRRLEESLQRVRDGEDRLLRTTNSLLDPLVVMRAVPGADGAGMSFVCDYANPAAAEALSRLSPSVVIGRSLSDILRGVTGERLGAAFARVVDTGEPLVIDGFESGPPQDGGRGGRVIDIRAAKTGDSVVATWRDVTDRMAAEAERDEMRERLAVSQRMESVGRLAGGIAHDFNNMLAAIMWSTDLAAEAVGPDHPAIADLGEISDATRRSANLTRQLLAFARRQPAAPVVLDLNTVISSMLLMLRRLVREDIDIDWQPGTGLWPVLIDPSQVDQILVNFVVNAREAITGTGRITIETANMRGGDAMYEHAGAGDDHVAITVSDTGCGMDAATVARIFEPFFTTRGAGRGSGLGLATVYGIAHQNRGAVGVRSVAGEGTVFRLCLPRAEGDAAGPVAAYPASPAAAAHGSETILLVEDEPSLLRLGALLLGRLGYRVLSTSSPNEAVSIARDHPGPIDLLLTDVVMPERNGRDLAADVAAVRPGTRCLFMSGYTADVIASQGIADEGVRLLSKPFTQWDLAIAIRSALDGT
jgi:signal transduction histidine kinase/ActR/RegA family two-component response regulator